MRAEAGAVLGTFLLLVLAGLSPRWLPYNMDEFVHYQALGCATAPLSERLGVFRESCHLYDLRLPFSDRPLPLRSYLYIGSFPAAVFYPLWRVLPDPVAARVQGALFLLLAGALAVRYLRVRSRAVLLAGFVFPLVAASFLADEGPVGLSTVLLLGTLLLFRRAATAGSAPSRVLAAALAGLLIFLGIWTKLTFVWWSPALLVCGSREARNASLPSRSLAGAVLAVALSAGLPTLVLMTSLDNEGRPYYASVTRARISSDPGQSAGSAARLSSYLLDASRSAARTLELPWLPTDALPILLTAAILGWGLWSRPELRPELLLWLGAFALTFALSLPSPFTQWPHHVVLSVVFLVMALARVLDALPSRAFVASSVAVALVWLSLAVRLPRATPLLEASAEKDRLLEFVRAQGLDRRTLQVHTSWGTYYIAQLFGDRERAVVYLKALPDDEALLREVRRLGTGIGRPILLVSSRRRQRIETQALRTELGTPAETHRFGDWWALVYPLSP